MSKIGESIRGITKAWGGKTYGSGIGDAIRDLADNLPFAVKTEMVEIVPQQSVTTSKTGMINIAEDFNLIPNNEYSVSLNGKIYVETAKLVSTEQVETNGMVYIGANPFIQADMDKPFGIIIHPARGKVCGVFDESLYNTTIALAIYEEQEVVKPLDVKYLPIEELKKALGLGGPV